MKKIITSKIFIIGIISVLLSIPIGMISDLINEENILF